ncbi:Ty1/Copia family ribonuclease HI, partial [Acinetobacter baumannii]|uniref:Ty1/Copia family ribonuclease HI n=1 Tax=Acinetobacter baumannii TaxID=470 RepID=UPI003393F70C
KNDKKSTSGFLIFLRPNLISWCTIKQPKVSRSSSEAEYRALALLAAETMWVTYILRELHATHTVPALYCDNKSTICVAKNSVLHTRMKHVDTDYLFVRDEVQAGTITVQYVPTEEQPADILTKPLPS